MGPEEASFYLRKNDGAIYGPVMRAALRDWATQGRVAPDDSLSKDKAAWYPAPTLPDLEMNWMVELPDGSQYGPVHLFALKDLVTEGEIADDANVTNRITEATTTLAEALGEPPAPREAPAQILPDVATQGDVIEEEQEVLGEEVAEPTPEETTTDEAPASPAPSPQSLAEWREIAQTKDQLAKELVKWKKMYEDERASASKAIEKFNERTEELRKNELAARMQIEQLEHKLHAVEHDHELFKKTVEDDSGDQLVVIMEAYSEFSSRYDSLIQQLTEKSEEIQNLLESRTRTEEYAREQVKRMEEITSREREEADNARRRAAEIEDTHLQLVKSYRDLNDRFINMRQKSSNDEPGGMTPAQPEPTPEREERGHSKVRLTRSRRK